MSLYLFLSLSHTKSLSFISLHFSPSHISLLSSLVPCYPINSLSLPQCLSSLVLIIKLDLVQVAGGKTNSHCRHQTDNALQLTFVFSITCGLGNEKRMVDVTLPHRHTHMHAHSVNRVLTRFKTMTTNSECGFLPVVYGLDFTVRLLSCFCLQPHLTLLSHV